MTDLATNPQGDDAVSDDLDTAAAQGVENDALDTNLDTNLDNDGLGGDDQQPDPADDLEEVDYEGAKYSVPKTLAPALMRQADYTQKTQALAAERTTLSTVQQALAQQVQTFEATKVERTQLAVLDHQIAQYTPEALRQVATERPEDLALVQLELQQLRDERAKVDGSITQKETQALDAQRQAVTQAQQAMVTTLQKDIPGWNNDLANKVTEFTVAQFGYTPQELRQVTDARVVKVLHLAMLGHQAAQAQKTTQRVERQQRTAPAQAITSRGAGGRIQAAADTDDFGAFERLADQRIAAKR